MRILLDECIDRRFAAELSHHEVKTVPQMGWIGVKNGSLMKLAEKTFDVFTAEPARERVVVLPEKDAA